MFRLLLLWFLVTALNGCATHPLNSLPVSDESHQMWQQRLLDLSTVDQWFIRGRIALFVDDDVYNLGLGWKRQGETSALKLEASLGQGLIQLKKNASQVSLTTSEGEKFQGTNAEQVLYQSTGLNIPVEGLETWIKGIPHPSSSFLPDINAAGQAKSLQQDGWTINYFDYEPVTLAHNTQTVLPRKLYMKHNGLALKIVIDQWQNPAVKFEADYFPVFPD